MIGRSEIRERAIKAFGKPTGESRDEIRFGRKGSIGVALTGEKAGLFYNFEAGQGGSLLEKEDLPDRPEYRPRKYRRIEYDTRKTQFIRRIVDSLKSVKGTPAEIYLRSRGITRWPHSIRFCSAPQALIAVAQDQGGAIKAFQRIFLTDGGVKQPITTSGGETAKTTHAVGRGWHEVACVRLPGRGGEPILCEGVETGLSIWMATGRTVLPCLGNGGFDALYLPGKRVTIARDGDRPGSDADKRIMRAVEKRKVSHRVKLTSTPIGLDFNDIHQKQGLEAVDRIIKEALPQ